jgi:hypothetical protein
MTKLYDDSTSSNNGSLQLTAHDDGLLGVGAYGEGTVYQSFKSGTLSATLTSIQLQLSDSAAASDGGSLTVGLYSSSAGAPGALVATLGTLADTTISTAANGAFDTLAISSAYTLSTSTTYWIGLTWSLTTDAGPYWHYTTTPVGTTGEDSDSHAGLSTNENLMVLNDSSLCFAAGSRVLTARGEVDVEALLESDLVVGMRSGKLLQIRWIGQRDVDLRAHPHPESINPVRVCADAFGPGQPHRDLILSPNHALYVDGAFIAVRYLINGATIRQEHWDRITYYHVELEAHDVMLVDGMTAESFLDIGNRAAFSNGGGPVMLHPDFAMQTWEAQACAPDLPKGDELTHLRQMLLDRTEALGHALSADPDICVIAGKRQIRPIEVAGGFRFNLPKGTTTVRIDSRCFRPSEVRADGHDARLLGVGVRSLTLDSTMIALDDPRLTVGWHAPEPDLRWTQGEATLRTNGARTLILNLHRGRHYWVPAEVAQGAHAAA